MSTNKNQNPEMIGAAIGLLISRRDARLRKALKFVRAAAGLDDSVGGDKHSVWRDELRIVEKLLQSICNDARSQVEVSRNIDSWVEGLFGDDDWMSVLDMGFRDCEKAWVHDLVDKSMNHEEE